MRPTKVFVDNDEMIRHNRGCMKPLGAFLCIVPLLAAQDFTHFEAVSIRPSPPSNLPLGMVPGPKVHGGVGTDDPGQITYETVQPAGLVDQAYGPLKGFQLVLNMKEKPSPLAVFDITAKIPAGATQKQFQVMLQNMMTERFHLRFHREMRETDVYALVAGPNGPKLKKSVPCDDPPPAEAQKTIAVRKDGFLALPACFTGVRAMPKPGRMFLSGRNVPVSSLAGGLLERSAGRPIVDQTGLTDHYDFDVEFEYAAGRGGNGANTPDDPAQSVFTMVEHDLGLKLVPKKIPFEYLVVDNLDKEPSEN